MELPKFSIKIPNMFFKIKLLEGTTRFPILTALSFMSKLMRSIAQALKDKCDANGLHNMPLISQDQSSM